MVVVWVLEAARATDRAPRGKGWASSRRELMQKGVREMSSWRWSCRMVVKRASRRL